MADTTAPEITKEAADANPPPAEDAQPKEKKLTKKELRILARQQKQAEAAAQASAEDPDKFGDSPMIQSREITGKKLTRVGDLNATLAGQKVWVRGFVFTSRALGKQCFLLIRQASATVQVIVMKTKENPAGMVKYASKIPKESVVDIYGELCTVPSPIASATQSDIELHAEKIFTVSKSDERLPFQVEDAARPEHMVSEEASLAAVNLDTRLNARWLDIRVPANHAIMKISSGVGRFFREFLIDRDFVEIHTPKLIGGASEGGANVFKLKYFNQDACLSQSPQLAKQMAAACCGLERVFEVGPVFRAEDSNTHRHMTEFTGLDMEMAINEHYFEVLDVLGEMFIYIFDKLNEVYAKELEAVNQQFPFEPLKYCRPTLRLTFAEGVELLRQAGFEQDPMEDLRTETERELGKIVREKYGTDFFILDKFPLAVRPFYTMPDPNNKDLSNSYDFFIRGEEILSGAQRVHDVNLLQERAKSLGVPIESIQSYVDSFRNGALPHGGGGVGLERVVMLFMGLKNIRRASLFPRDPKRLTP